MIKPCDLNIPNILQMENKFKKLNLKKRKYNLIIKSNNIFIY